SDAEMEGGTLTLQHAYNDPVWLTRPIPSDASVEFDCWSESPDGDIKVESWGDGASYHYGRPQEAYTSTGYVFIFGGWRNTTSVLARQSEHTQNRAARSDGKVEPGKRYHLKDDPRGGGGARYMAGRFSFRSRTRPRLPARTINSSRSPASSRRCTSTTCGSSLFRRVPLPGAHLLLRRAHQLALALVASQLLQVVRAGGSARAFRK